LILSILYLIEDYPKIS